jgi:hypothetical protein
MDATNTRPADAFTSFEVDVSWHETRLPYSSKFTGPRKVEGLRYAVEDNDRFGRMFTVYGYLTEGGRVRLSWDAVAAIVG